MLQVAIEAATSAGKYLKQNIGKFKSVQQKYGQDRNLVTEIDKKSEALIIEIISSHYPSHDILAEESGNDKGKPSEYRWIIDPLDGTTNFTHGLPIFCVSIGVEYAGEMIAGVIYDPNTDELFTSEKGRGAFLNGKRIHVSQVDHISRSILVTGFPYNIIENPDYAVEHFINFLMKAQAVRRLGSAALDLAYLAAGRFDGFWEVALQPWDMAAGVLILHESGGMVSDFSGTKFNLYGKQLLASNAAIHNQMLDVIRLVKE
ncbi:MAG: inositol monophosphatase [Ignavibacteriales bacterium]|nr:inositol monophosphatase [Ignavibacteriales bacterium]